MIQSRTRPRSRWKSCRKTLSAHTGTMFEGLRTPVSLIVIVVTLLSSGCPIQAIVHACDVDERTVASWRDRAGKHSQQVHEAVIQQGQLDLVHVHADEIRVTGRTMSAWMGVAMMVSTRVWLGGVVQMTRDRNLADRVLSHVRACRPSVCALLVCTDGWSASPNSIRRACRETVKTTAGRGRACVQVWPDLLMATIITRTEKKRVVDVTRRMAQGTLEAAQKLLGASQGGTVLTTAFLERVNGTVRQRLASLTRTCRHAARRVAALETGMDVSGCTSTVCWPHHELSRRAASAQDKRGEILLTPAMASGLTDHVWSIFELLSSRIAPSPWVEPRRRRRPKKQAGVDVPRTSSGPRPLLRLRKGVVCSSTSEWSPTSQLPTSGFLDGHLNGNTITSQTDTPHVLKKNTAFGEMRMSCVSQTLLMNRSCLCWTEKEKTLLCVDEDQMFHGVARFLAALVPFLLISVFGTLNPSFGPIMTQRGGRTSCFFVASAG